MLLPAFAGELASSETRSGSSLRLSGAYSVPLGSIGTFGDCVLGRRLDPHSLGTLLERVAARLDAEPDADLRAPASHAHRFPVMMHEGDRSELYVA